MKIVIECENAAELREALEVLRNDPPPRIYNTGVLTHRMREPFKINEECYRGFRKPPAANVEPITIKAEKLAELTDCHQAPAEKQPKTQSDYQRAYRQRKAEREGRSYTPRYGNKLSPEHRQKLNDSRKGKIPGNWLTCTRCNKQKGPRWLNKETGICHTCAKKGAEPAPAQQDSPDKPFFAPPPETVLDYAPVPKWIRVEIRQLLDGLKEEYKKGVFKVGDVMRILDCDLQHARRIMLNLRDDNLAEVVGREKDHLAEWRLI